jgi:anaerobic selenocysteine-containing dehydrogenase
MHAPHTPALPSGPSTTREVQGVCNLCEAICGVVFTVQGSAPHERIISVKGNVADPLSRGHICPKAVALKDLHEDPDRLRQPVKRVTRHGQTSWQPIGWDEAFDLVTEGLAKVREQHGANAVAVYQGNPSVHNWGNSTHGHLFFSQLKTRHRYSATSVDQLPHHMTALWLYGHQMRLPIPDIDRTQYFMVIGGNPLASNGSLMTVPDVRQRLKALQQRGGKLVVIDPRRTETAAVANEHHFITPGTDAAWLLAIVHTLLAEQLTQPGPWAPLLDGMEALQAAVAPYTPDAVATFTGIDADTTRRLARELAHSQAAACYGRMGVSTQVHGVICQWAIQVINLLTGNVDREGGTLLTHPALDLIRMGVLSPGHYDLWRSRVRQAPEFGGELPVSTMAEEMLTPGPGQVRALVTSCGNPVLSTPNGRQLDRALEGLDFMVSVDFFINETTRHAHVILPPTCAVEHDHYDLIFLMLAVRNVARYSPPVLSKAPGSMDDWQIYSALAQRYARRIWASERASVGQRLKGLATRGLMARLSPRTLLRIGLKKGKAPISFQQLLAHPEGVDLGALRPGLIDTLNRSKRRVGLLPPAVAQALPDLWHQVQTPTPGHRALQLIGRRDVRSNNSWMHNSERLVSGKARCVLWMHPQDALARQLSHGQTVCVQSRVGQVSAPLHVTDDIKPGVVSLPHGWGHDRPGIALRIAKDHAGVSLNDLTDDQLTDPVSGNAAFSGVAVEVRAA